MKKQMTALLALCLTGQTLKAQTIEKQDSLQEVVVTGTGTQHLLKNAPVQTEVITRQMLRNYGGSSLQDILSGLTASFAFSENDMGSQMQMNGLGNSYILILVDGKRLHGDNGGENDLGLIDPLSIEKIEIVKGASSALYGSDAIAGVINIITKRHDGAVTAENTLRVGSYGDVREHYGFGVTAGKLSSQTRFSVQHSDGWQNTATEDPHQTEYLITDSRNKTVNRFTNHQLYHRLTFDPCKQLQLYAEGSTYWKRIYRPKGKYPGVDIKTYDMEYNNESLSAGGEWKPGKGSTVTLDVDWHRHVYLYQYTAFTLTDGYDPNGNFTNYYPYFEGDSETQSDMRRTMAHLKGVFTLPMGHRLSAGAEWRHDLLKAPMRVEGGRASDHTEALYAQDEWQPALNTHHSPLTVTAGLRLTRNQQFGAHLTPKVSAMLSLGEAWRIRGTWSQGFKTPTPKELHYRYVRNMSGVYLFLGNEGLRPQTSNYYAIGGEWSQGGLNITITGYLNQVDRMITLVTIPNTQAPAEYVLQYDPRKTRQYQNLETARTRGIDLSARYRIGSEWLVGLSYSLLDTHAQSYDTDEEQLVDVVIDGTARHKGSWLATWNHRFGNSYRLGVGLYGRMSSRRYYQINGDGKGYQIWRLTTTHELGHSRRLDWRAEVGIDNILNYVDRTPHGLHLGTTTPGRTVYATLTVRLHEGKKITFSNNKTFNQNQTNNEQD